MKQLILKRRIPFLLGIWLVLLSACGPVRLISDYDEITDKTVTALQEKISGLLVKVETEIGTDAAKYEHYKTFYQDGKVDLNVLKVRADAIEKNRIVQEQIAALTIMTDYLEILHKIGFSSKEQIEPLKLPFNTPFTAIVKLQLGLKRGEKSSQQDSITF